MSKKNIIIIVIVIACVLLLFIFARGFFVTTSRKTADNGISSGNTLVQGRIPNPNTLNNNKSDKITFKTTRGDVQVLNFLVYPKSTGPDGKDIITMAKNSNYFVFYSLDGNFFSIQIFNDSQSATARKDAEYALLSVLGISEDDACKLPIDVLVQNKFTKQMDPTNFGLSFCIGSLLLFDQ